MELYLYRDIFDSVSTEGDLFVEGAHECYTLELPNKDGRPGSCIPRGRYRIELEPSPKFLHLAADTNLNVVSRAFWQKYASQMPHITGIPTRSLIMLHPGNRVAQTDGCVLVGQGRGDDLVWSSDAAFEALFPKIKQACENEGCWITVVGGAVIDTATVPTASI